MTAVSFDRDCGFCIGCVDHFEKNNRSNSSCAKGRKLAIIKGGETDAGLYVLADFKGGLEEVWRLGFLDKKSQKWYNKKSIIL